MAINKPNISRKMGGMEAFGFDFLTP